MMQDDGAPLYDPKGNSTEKASEGVHFVEAKPPPHLRSIVHRYLSVWTETDLPSPYRFHALPDACTYVVFDQRAPDICGVTRLKASSEELDLGHAFHFVNIRFLPGVWQQKAAYGLVDTEYTGELPLRAVNRRMAGQPFAVQQDYLSDFVDELVQQERVMPNPVAEKIFAQIDDIHTVADMADIAQLSPRQLQRVLKRTTGFAPHDFLKVIRLQQSLGGEPSLSYADQSHFIHSFRKATGYTPGQYARKFDV